MKPKLAWQIAERMNDLNVPDHIPEIHMVVNTWAKDGGLLKVTDLAEGGQKIELFQQPHQFRKP